MTKIKIVSNPYNRSLAYYIFKEKSNSWEDIKQDSINSRLREDDEEKIFLPFKIKEIIDTIIAEYHVGTDPIELVFEGTADEYEELLNICDDPEVRDKVQLFRSNRVLENARDILDHAKEIFDTVQPIIKNIVKDDEDITKGLFKVSDALKDIIPICIFGNYSAGKSTFINALIGYEILPSGGDPVTSKIYEIKRSGQKDRARVSFAFKGEEFELLFDNKECRISAGNRENALIQDILSEISKIEELSLFKMVNTTIELLNSFEKKDRTTTLISNVIKIDVPFSENGKLGQSHNEFVIFDTPGSNSNTNMDHEKVLTDSLDGFSNGIPIWVSGYDSIDSIDNAHLCDKLYKIEALDKRFTMIVINKADSVELPGDGLGEDAINNIMEYESVEKMYSSGIYFVSSIMGLGAKNLEGIYNDYLLEVFDEKKRKFSDPSAKSYKKLYEYNIMPEQMKARAIAYSLDCNNLIYANSGLLCVEMEMEQFASKHAAYNKCQMVYAFLKGIIDETGRRIADKTALRERNKKTREQELDTKRSELIKSIRKETQNSVKNYERHSEVLIKDYVTENLVYDRTPEELEEIDQLIAERYEHDGNLSSYERDYEDARINRRKNLVESSRNIFNGNFVESIKNLTIRWVTDSSMVQQKKKSMDSIRQDIDKATSEKTINQVIKDFKKNIIDAQRKLEDVARKHWQENAQAYRDEMVMLINGSDALSEKQRTDISNVILNYQLLQYDDHAEEVFIKTKFRRGNVLGLKFGGSERLNTYKLATIYNNKIRQDIEELSDIINEKCAYSFKQWQEKLQGAIEKRITIYNPELREITEIIRDETEIILELQTNQLTISNSFKTIKEMMEWKELV